MDFDKTQKIKDLYSTLPRKEKRLIIEMFKSGKFSEVSDRYDLLRSEIFIKPPPTPEEFLDPANKWLPEGVLDDKDFPTTRIDFLAITTKKKKYLQVVQYGATRQGKSFLARLLIMYTIVWVHHLKDPKLYYGLSKTTALTIYLLAFKIDKAKELLLDDLFKLLEASERFHQIRFKDKVKDIQEEVGPDIIVYSQASRVGFITLASDLRIVLGNDDPLSIIGANILQMYVSEIAFFIENAGATEEQIFRLYTDGVDRIRATVRDEYLSFMYLDTSANNADSVIENYILKELREDTSVYFQSRARWEARPHLAPIWQKTGETFKVITGNGSYPAKLITDDIQLEGIPPELVIQVPIDFKKRFEANLTKSIKDIAGKPTSSDNKFIPTQELVNAPFDNPTLVNIESLVVADTKDTTKHLVWNQIKERFTTVYDGTNRVFKRAPREPRFIGLDLATAADGDLAGFCLLHKEWSKIKQEILYVVDFCFAIGPGENGINLEAIYDLCVDIVKEGKLTISGAAVDKAASDYIRQALTRFNMPIIYQSVDVSIEPYLFLRSCLLTRQLKAGKNIFFKNNLNSLYQMKRKTAKGEKGKDIVDHSKNEKQNKHYNGDWMRSTAGLHGKDVSDSVCQALYTAKNDEGLPTTVYEEENMKYNIKLSTLDPSQMKSIKREALHTLQVYSTRVLPNATQSLMGSAKS